VCVIIDFIYDGSHLLVVLAAHRRGQPGRARKIAAGARCSCLIAALLCWQAVLKEVSDSNGKIVLFIDEIHTVVGAGATGGAMDAGEL